MQSYKLPFRKFSNGSLELGDYDENSDKAPEDRSGAYLVFDAYLKSRNYFAFRIYHYDKNQKISIESEGCSLELRKCEETKTEHHWYDFDSDENKSAEVIEYMTTIAWKINDIQGEGFIKVEVEGESLDFLMDDAKISWKDGVIKDFYNIKANLVFEGEILNISEILTDEERKQFVLDDRIYKLKLLLIKSKLVSAYNDLNYAWICGDFDLKNEVL